MWPVSGLYLLWLKIMAEDLSRRSARAAHQSRQRRFQLLGMKPERPRTAFVSHAPAAVDGIEPVGPAGVRRLCRVPEIVHQGRDRDMQVTHARVRHGFALLGATRAGDQDVLLDRKS